MTELWPLLMFVGTFIFLLSGFPVAFVLSGSALLFAGLGWCFGMFDSSFLGALPSRIFGIMTNETLIAVPLFVLMGLILERTKISENLLNSMSIALGRFRGGLGISVSLVGGLLAASTGIVGATVVTMGLISLPAMIRKNYPVRMSTGIICASGTLGQIIPPSIVLIILGDVMGSAYQQAQLETQGYTSDFISVGDLFVGALIPGLILMAAYSVYIIFYSYFSKEKLPKTEGSLNWSDLIKSLATPLFLILGVLGSILTGIATPTEAASVGCIGAFGLGVSKKGVSGEILKEIALKTTEISSMVFAIIIGASVFSLVFRGFGGDDLVRNFLMGISDQIGIKFLIVMIVIFLLGFFLDFFEITFVVVPIVGPVLLSMGLDPIWLGVMIALNLQTSFLTPPFGFSLFYLRGVAPPEIKTGDIYRGVIPFIIIQIGLMGLIWLVPEIATWLPAKIF